MATNSSTDERPGRRAIVRAGDGPGKGPLGNFGIVVLIVFFLILGTLLLWALWAFWPTEVSPANGQGEPTQSDKATFLFIDFKNVGYDVRLGVLVAVAGALGGALHALRSLVYYIGNRRFIRSWVPFYLLRPLLGAILATAFYIVVRAGLFNPAPAADATVNPYGFAAVALLVGLFSEMALQKLEDLFRVAFTTAPEAADSLESTATQVVTGAAKDVSTTGATLTGTIKAAPGELTYFFEYGPTTAYGTPTTKVTATATEQILPAEAAITGVAGSLIHYRLVADAGGVLTRGEDKTVQLP